MVALSILAAAAQVQTIQLPPVPPPAVQRIEPSLAERQQLPDLVVSGVRMVSEFVPEFEVRNQGPSEAKGPILLKACVYLDVGRTGELTGVYRIHCSDLHQVGALAGGESKWIRIDCFLGEPRVGYSSGGLWGGPGTVKVEPPQCVSINIIPDTKIARFTAQVDPSLAMAEGPRAAPSRVQADCDSHTGCVRESVETNNRVSFEAPFGS